MPTLSYKLVTPPAVEPVSLQLAKQQCRVDFSDDDDLISAYISAAREYAERYTNRAFFNQTWLLSLDTFPYFGGGGTIPTRQRGDYPLYAGYWDQITIRLPRPAAVSVTSIKYIDLTNTLQTLDPASYYLDTVSEPARIVPNPGTYWPYTQNYLPGSVQVSFVAGTYGDGTDTNTCPACVVQAILLLVGHMYENRSMTSQGVTVSKVPLAVEALLDTVRFETFGFGNN